MFRDFGLVSRLAMFRGMRLPLLCTNIPIHRHMSQIGGTLREVRVNRHARRCPRRLSKNRRRHITVTQTVIAGPGVVLTSRPANGLSSAGNGRIVLLLGRLGGSKTAIIVMARSRRGTRRTNHVIQVVSNYVLARGEQ